MTVKDIDWHPHVLIAGTTVTGVTQRPWRQGGQELIYCWFYCAAASACQERCLDTVVSLPNNVFQVAIHSY